MLLDFSVQVWVAFRELGLACIADVEVDDDLEFLVCVAALAVVLRRIRPGDEASESSAVGAFLRDDLP